MDTTASDVSITEAEMHGGTSMTQLQHAGLVVQAVIVIGNFRSAYRGQNVGAQSLSMV